MKLFIYDQKHDNINGTLDLGDITQKEQVNITKIIKFLEEQHITNRYNSLVVAKDYTVEYDYDGNTNIEFT